MASDNDFHANNTFRETSEVLPDEQQVLITRIKRIFGARAMSNEEADFYLQNTGWNLERAVTMYDRRNQAVETELRQAHRNLLNTLASTSQNTPGQGSGGPQQSNTISGQDDNSTAQVNGVSEGSAQPSQADNSSAGIVQPVQSTATDGNDSFQIENDRIRDHRYKCDLCGALRTFQRDFRRHKRKQCVQHISDFELTGSSITANEWHGRGNDQDHRGPIVPAQQ